MLCVKERCQARRTMAKLGTHGRISADAAAQEFRLNDGRTLAEASEQAPVVLVFLRHFGCTFTRQLLRGLQQLKIAADEQNAQLVLVHMLDQGSEQNHLSSHSEVLRISDPQCRLYRAFGLGNGGLIELFGPQVWWLGLISIFKGCGVGGLAGNGLQMPGAFIFHHNRIIAAQRAKNAAQLPDLPQLFDTTNHSLES